MYSKTSTLTVLLVFSLAFLSCQGQDSSSSTASPEVASPEATSPEVASPEVTSPVVSSESTSPGTAADCQGMAAAGSETSVCEEEGKTVLKVCKEKMLPCKVTCVYSEGDPVEKMLEDGRFCCDMGIVPTGRCKDGQCELLIKPLTNLITGK